MPARLARLPDPLKRDISETKVFGPMFEDQLKLWGWHAEHHRPGMRANGRWATMVSADGVGWPDYFCIHRGTGDVFAAELKVRYDKPTEAQMEWLALLDLAGIETHVWWPPDWPQIVDRLSSPVAGRDRSRGGT